jgi:hypothetical protein
MTSRPQSCETAAEFMINNIEAGFSVRESGVAGRETAGRAGWRVARILGENAILFVVLVLATVKMTALISLPPTNLNAIWLPTGIGLAALLTKPGWSAVPTIWLANWVGDTLLHTHGLLPSDAYHCLLCTANTLEPVVGCLLWRRFLKVSPFADGWQFLKFTFGVALVPALMTRTIIIGIIWMYGYLHGHNLERFFLRSGIIAISDTLGVFLVIPLLLAPWDSGMAKTRPRRFIVHGLNIMIAVFVCWMSFHVLSLAIYLAIPLALIAALVCGARGAAASVLIVSVYGMAATARGIGPFVMHGAESFAPSPPFSKWGRSRFPWGFRAFSRASRSTNCAVTGLISRNW